MNAEHQVWVNPRSGEIPHARPGDCPVAACPPEPPPPAPDAVIDVSDDASLRRWAEHFGVTPSQIEQAVQAAGPQVRDVQRHLLDQGASAGAG